MLNLDEGLPAGPMVTCVLIALFLKWIDYKIISVDLETSHIFDSSCWPGVKLFPYLSDSDYSFIKINWFYPVSLDIENKY